MDTRLGLELDLDGRSTMSAALIRHEVRIRGKYACFTRAEFKTERLSYEVLTPSAARGVLEAILWKPAIFWHIRRIRRMCQKMAGFQRMASRTPRAAEGVRTSYESLSVLNSARVKQAYLPRIRTSWRIKAADIVDLPSRSNSRPRRVSMSMFFNKFVEV